MMRRIWIAVTLSALLSACAATGGGTTGTVHGTAVASTPVMKVSVSFSDHDRKMLAMRIGASSNIMMIQGQVYGPEGKNRVNDMDFSPAIQLGSFNAGSYQDEDELAAWYARWRLPRSMGTMPGCIQVRKLISISGWAKHACFYEFTSLQARNENFVNHEKFDPAMEEWTDRVVRKLMHAPGLPNVARRIWPPVPTNSRRNK